MAEEKTKAEIALETLKDLGCKAKWVEELSDDQKIYWAEKLQKAHDTIADEAIVKELRENADANLTKRYDDLVVLQRQTRQENNQMKESVKSKIAELGKLVK